MKEHPTAETLASSAVWTLFVIPGADDMNPTPKGRSVFSLTAWICSLSHVGSGSRVAPIIPNAPVLVTADASAAPALPVIGALIIGKSISNREQSLVLIKAGTPGDCLTGKVPIFPTLLDLGNFYERRRFLFFLGY